MFRLMHWLRLKVYRLFRVRRLEALVADQYGHRRGPVAAMFVPKGLVTAEEVRTYFLNKGIRLKWVRRHADGHLFDGLLSD